MTDNLQMIPSKEINRSTKIGRGGFGVVYKGSWHGYQVAIKTIRQDLDKDLEAEFKREASVMAKLNHPGIIRLYGICTEPGNFAMLVELMPKGDLLHFLRDKKQALPWNPLRWQLAIDIGAGLAYLHSNKILHRDLKSENVLLDHNLRAKITDFGLSRIKLHSSTLYTNRQGGTLLWMAPELFKRNAKLTAKADVYAYGMILWEIASRKLPFADGHSSKIIEHWIKEGEKEDIPKGCPPAYARVIQLCWDQDPTKRPFASDALKQLRIAQPKQEEAPLSNRNISSIESTSSGSSFSHMSEQIKKTLSTKTGFSFGSEEFRRTSTRYATSFKDGVPTKLWNTETGKLIRSFCTHDNAIFALCNISTNKVAVGYYDRTIRIWNLKNRECEQTLNGHTCGVYGLAELEGGQLASASLDKTVRIWNIKDGKLLKTLEGHTDWVQAVVALPGHRLASASFDKTIKVWDVTTGKCLLTLSGHAYGVSALVRLSDGRLASGSYDHTIKLWDTNKGECVRTLEGHTDAITALVQLPEGSLVSSSYDKSVKSWDLKSGQHKYTQSMEELPLSLYPLKEGLVIVGRSNGQVSRLNALIGIPFFSVAQFNYHPQCHQQPVTGVSVQNGWKVSASEDGTLKLGKVNWNELVVTLQPVLPVSDSKIDVNQWGCLKTLTNATQYGTSLCFLKDNLLLVEFGVWVRVWDWKRGERVHQFSAGRKKVCSVAKISANKVAVTSGERPIKIWDFSEKRITQTDLKAPNSVMALSCIGEGQWVSAGLGFLDTHVLDQKIRQQSIETSKKIDQIENLGNGFVATTHVSHPTIRIWDVVSDVETWEFSGHYRVLAHNKLNLLASTLGKDAGRIDIWDIKKKAFLYRIKAPENVNSLVWINDVLLAGGLKSGQIMIWNVTTSQCLKTLKGHTQPVNSLCLIGDQTLASASSDGAIKIWGPKQ